MIDEILYGGITATPNDYEAPDGDLEAMVNLINEDNQLKPVGQASEVFPLANTAQRIIFVHKGTAYKNYIILDSSNPNAPVLKYKEGEDGTIENLTTSNACTGFRKAAAVGNILIIATGGGFLYYYFGGVDYTFLGNELPHINASFALDGELAVETAREAVFKFDKTQDGQSPSVDPQESETQLASTQITFTDTLTQALIVLEDGQGHPLIKQNGEYTFKTASIVLNGYMVLYVNDDGSMDTWCMVPSNGGTSFNMPMPDRDVRKIAIYPGWGNQSDQPTSGHSVSTTVTIIQRTIEIEQPYDLTMSTLAENLTTADGIANEFLAKMRAKNKFIYPFFLRYTIELYDGSEIQPSAPILMIPNYKIAPIMPMLFLERGSSEQIKERPLNCNVYASAIACDIQMKLYIGDDGSTLINQWSDLISSIKIYATSPIYTYDQAYEFKEGEKNLDIEMPSRGLTKSLSKEEKDLWYLFQEYCRERSLQVPAFWIKLPQKNDDDIINSFKTTSPFYLICQIPYNDFTKYNSGYETIQIGKDVYTNLEQQEALKDGNASRNSILPTTVFAYNSRLITAADERIVYKGDFLPLQTGLINGEADSEHYIVDIYLDINGVERKVRRNTQSLGLNAQWTPRWFFYPDARAKRARVYQFIENGSYSLQYYADLPLLPHPFLSGAYFFSEYGVQFHNGSGMQDFPDPDAPDIDIEEPTNAEIYVSEPANPFAYDPANTIKVGSTHVISFSAATMALSENQSGRFPLYVFTNEGVWALETNSDGTFSMPSPVTRDVVLGAGESITQIDSAVLFATARGIMLLQGKTSQCISDTLINTTGFVIPSHLAALTGVEGDITSAVPFLDYISDCRILYDYTNQRFIVFSAQYNYAYAYSLKSKKWALMYQHITEVFNSYPDAYAQSDTIVRDYSHESDIPNVNAVPFDGTVEDAVDQMVGITNPDHIYYVTAKHMFMAERSGLYYSSWTNSEDYNDYPVARQDVVFCLTTSIGSRYKFNGADLVLTSILPQLLITRPLKLSQPNALKTVDTIIQRGVFNKTHVRSVLYGSRDLINWHIVFTSTNHILRGFRGTPYKYFRIALICDLTSTESISGCTVQWQPRQTNQPR